MAHWTATTTTKASPEQLLEVLTHPEEIRRWSPVDFDLDELDSSRLAPGSRARVTGKLAGVRVGFDVEVHAADDDVLELSADGPVGLDVRYELAPADTGSELYASVSLRRGGGITGRARGQRDRRAAVRRRTRRSRGPHRPGRPTRSPGCLTNPKENPCTTTRQPRRPDRARRARRSSADSLVRRYGDGDSAVDAVRGVSLEVPPASSPRSWARAAPASPP